MHLQHFGIAQYPFSLTPDTRFFLKLPSHVRIFDELIKALANQAGFSKITGEVGTGKTMLCRKSLNALEYPGSGYVTAYVPHPILSEEGLLHAVAEEFGVAHDGRTDFSAMLKHLTRHLAELQADGKRPVLFIDEAQAMPVETLESVRLLTFPGSQGAPLLQVVLFGQPELDRVLASPELHALQRQIQCNLVLPPLDRNGVEAYVAHRLTKAGFNGSVLFSRSALGRLFDASGGIPRLVNVLPHKALMAAFGKGRHLVDASHIDAAIADTEAANPIRRNTVKRLLRS